MPASPDILGGLLAQVDKLRASGDPESACQVLFLCAVLSKHLKEYPAALQMLQQVSNLASQHNLTHVVPWVAWGSAAIHLNQGHVQQAAEQLNGLHSLLKQAGDWILADLIETLLATLPDLVPESFQRDRLVGWLLGWGETPFSLKSPYRGSKSGSPAYQTGFKRITSRLSAILEGTLHNLLQRKSFLALNSQLIALAGIVEPISVPIRFNAPASFPLDSVGMDGKKEPSLVVYCLGQFQAYQDDQPIEDWPNYKSKLIFKFLITHRERPLAKELLMDVFWPDSPPGAARNNLNVAIHGIRKVLHLTRPNFSHILFKEGQYWLNPKLTIWIDAEEFSKHIKIAQNLKASADPAVILREYQKAETLYQGDFLEEDRYEEWTIIPRESLRLAYLDCLSQLSQVYFQQEQYLAASSLCQRILAYDDCSENAYCLLMRCYARQGQPNLALRLYHACRATLRTELDMPPSPETQSLFERIRGYKPV